MTHYHDENDLKVLKEMSQQSLDEFRSWLNQDDVAGKNRGHIPRRYWELIALAVALTTQCADCVEAHTRAAKLAGAKREEISEVAFLAVALRGGRAATHGALALKFFDQDSR